MERAQELKKQIQDLVTELYSMDLKERVVEPIYPWHLVWILPKTTKRAGIIMPEQQNKVVHEGIVVSSWKPFWKKTTRVGSDSGFAYQQYIEPHLHPGDHIIFPHWSGQPAGFLDNKEYRFIKEVSDYNPPDTPPARFEFDQLDVIEELAQSITDSEVISPVTGDRQLLPGKIFTRQIAESLLKSYYIVPRLGQQPRTLSGQ